MKAAANPTFAERIGWTFGLMWRTGARCECKARGWLVARGLKPSVATGVLLTVKLVVVVMLLYSAFWLALLLLLMVLGAWGARRGGLGEDEQKPEWRMGLSGYGLYRGDVRVDPGSPDDD